MVMLAIAMVLVCSGGGGCGSVILRHIRQQFQIMCKHVFRFFSVSNCQFFFYRKYMFYLCTAIILFNYVI